MISTMTTYHQLMCTFAGVSVIRIKYQKLEIIDNQACKFADVISHELSQDEYRISVEQLVNKLRPFVGHCWVSSIKVKSHVLLCVATTKYHDIKRFKALQEQQVVRAASENAVIVRQNDLASIFSVEDVTKVALRICPISRIESEPEYHPTFHYHVVEDAILNVNGWECLQRVDDRLVPIEDDEWLVEQKARLLKEYPWVSVFNPPRSLLEYGLKLLTPNAGAKGTDEMRQRMLTKALKARASLVVNTKPDLGHAFCMAVLLIAIYQCSHEWHNKLMTSFFCALILAVFFNSIFFYLINFSLRWLNQRSCEWRIFERWVKQRSSLLHLPIRKLDRKEPRWSSRLSDQLMKMPSDSTLERIQLWRWMKLLRTMKRRARLMKNSKRSTTNDRTRSKKTNTHAPTTTMSFFGQTIPQDSKADGVHSYFSFGANEARAKPRFHQHASEKSSPDESSAHTGGRRKRANLPPFKLESGAQRKPIEILVLNDLVKHNSGLNVNAASHPTHHQSWHV